MGDVAMTVPVLLALTERYPSVKITVLTKEFFAPIVSSVPGVAVKVAAVKGRHKGLIGLWRLFRELRELQLDAVADLHNVMRSNVLKLFFQLSGIPFKQIKKGRKEKRALTKWEEKTITPLKTTHERYADVFRALGFAMELRETHVLSKSIRGDFKDISFDKAKKWVGIAPFAAFDGKMYPSALMEAVLMKLSERTNLSVLLFGGGEAEKNQLEVWSQQFQNCTNLVGKFTFPEELAVISSLDLMVSMDSGNAHLAAMYGVPTVTLWGVTHPYAGFYPYAQPMENALLSNREKHPYIPTSVYGNKFPEGYEMVMETIDPKRVIEKINTILGVAP
jgi:ADP-heptose:LPS heptosyltransferase